MKIITERLLLREWNKGDVYAILDGLRDIDTAKNLTVPYPYRLSDAVDFVNKHSIHTENSYYFAITLKSTGEVIGATNIKLIDNYAKGGIWLNKKYQGRGYGTEAFRARAKFAFDKLHVDYLENGYFDYNMASKHMQEKIGYKVVGEKENFSPALNKPVTEIVTRLDKTDFK